MTFLSSYDKMQIPTWSLKLFRHTNKISSKIMKYLRSWKRFRKNWWFYFTKLSVSCCFHATNSCPKQASKSKSIRRGSLPNSQSFIVIGAARTEQHKQQHQRQFDDRARSFLSHMHGRQQHRQTETKIKKCLRKARKVNWLVFTNRK